MKQFLIFSLFLFLGLSSHAQMEQNLIGQWKSIKKSEYTNLTGRILTRYVPFRGEQILTFTDRICYIRFKNSAVDHPHHFRIRNNKIMTLIIDTQYLKENKNVNSIDGLSAQPVEYEFKYINDNYFSLRKIDKNYTGLGESIIVYERVLSQF